MTIPYSELHQRSWISVRPTDPGALGLKAATAFDFSTPNVNFTLPPRLGDAIIPPEGQTTDGVIMTAVITKPTLPAPAVVTKTSGGPAARTASGYTRSHCPTAGPAFCSKRCSRTYASMTANTARSGPSRMPADALWPPRRPSVSFWIIFTSGRSSVCSSAPALSAVPMQLWTDLIASPGCCAISTNSAAISTSK